MSSRLRALFVGFLLLGLLVLGSNLAVRPELVQGFLLGAAPKLGSAEALALTVNLPKQSAALEYGTQAEVLRFSVEAEEDFSLRYLTLAVRSQGLILPSAARDWKVYLVKDGRVDFASEVGYGESFDGTFLKLRLSHSPAVAYWGNRGKQEFALVTGVLKEGEEAGWLGASFPAVSPEGFGWAFAAGQHEEPWMNVASAFDSTAVKGLPTMEVRRD